MGKNKNKTEQTKPEEPAPVVNNQPVEESTNKTSVEINPYIDVVVKKLRNLKKK